MVFASEIIKGLFLKQKKTNKHKQNKTKTNNFSGHVQECIMCPKPMLIMHRKMVFVI